MDKYRIREYIDKNVFEQRWFVAQYKHRFFGWEDMKSTTSHTYSNCKKRLCQILRPSKELDKFHEVDCDETV